MVLSDAVCNRLAHCPSGRSSAAVPPRSQHPVPVFVCPDLPVCDGCTLSPTPGPLFPFPVSSKPLPPPITLSPLRLRLKRRDVCPAVSPASGVGGAACVPSPLPPGCWRSESLPGLLARGCLPSLCPLLPAACCCLQPAGEASSQQAESLGSRAELHACCEGTGMSSISPRRERGLGSGSQRHEMLTTPCCFMFLKLSSLQR